MRLSLLNWRSQKDFLDNTMPFHCEVGLSYEIVDCIVYMFAAWYCLLYFHASCWTVFCTRWWVYDSFLSMGRCILWQCQVRPSPIAWWHVCACGDWHHQFWMFGFLWIYTSKTLVNRNCIHNYTSCSVGNGNDSG